jgi:RimJ/RimL family protein N-acetyltransferase
MSSQRLCYRKPKESDAAFIYDLVNEHDWIKYIGDRKVTSQEDAVRFINESLNTKQSLDGLGLRVCCLVSSELSGGNSNKDTPIGLCGLLKREYLDSIDIGYAFTSKYRGLGYGLEAASFFKTYAFNHLNIEKLYATVSKENEQSISLLEKLDFRYLRGLKGNSKEFENIMLYVSLNATHIDSIIQSRHTEPQ